MATTTDRGEDITELGQRLLDKKPNAQYAQGGGIKETEYRIPPAFVIQCRGEIDQGIYNTLEEAVIRWIQLRIEGKI